MLEASMSEKDRFIALLQEGLRAQGITLPCSALEGLWRHFVLVREWNRRCNLTAVDELEKAAALHYLDSLAPLSFFSPPEGPCLDVGSGAGFPGVPLAVALPRVSFVLMEATRKKADFLSLVVRDLSLTNCRVVWGRAEEYGARSEYRERFDWVLARAVAPMAQLLEYTLPFAALGGGVLAYKGPRAEEEVAQASAALSLLGGKVEEVRSYALPGGIRRVLVWIRKVAPTPERYPRSSAQVRKRPLGPLPAGRKWRENC
ncbi:16S rRNA (guanine(527)-N(7))-methyltransferase RsmG [Desulfothermobacter acidiphilus]|uniref:16S rRNA (guanine(527)-N(7))-methyltransferase RsmG n=1 Tax=Desulfothermobacter acidiphilus TaxID=1938353 RepID=UPI003F8920E9